MSGKGYSGLVCDVSDFNHAFCIVETNYHLSIESVYNKALKYTLSNLI